VAVIISGVTEYDDGGGNGNGGSRMRTLIEYIYITYSSRAPVAVVHGADGGHMRSRSIKHVSRLIVYKRKKNIPRGSRPTRLEPLPALSSQLIPC